MGQFPKGGLHWGRGKRYHGSKRKQPLRSLVGLDVLRKSKAAFQDWCRMAFSSPHKAYDGTSCGEKMTSKTWILVRDVLCWNMAGAYPGFHKATPRKFHVRAKAENLFIS